MERSQIGSLNGIVSAPCPSPSARVNTTTMVEHVEKLPHAAPRPGSLLRLALFEPDIPQNAGTLMRLGACLGVPVDLIEPAGFDASDRNLRRAGLDYLDALSLTRHLSFLHFDTWRRDSGHRLLLATTRGAIRHVDFTFQPGDIIMLGRESAGVPESVHEAVDARIAIPLQPGLRSLNVAVSGAILLGEALRRLDGFASLPALGAPSLTPPQPDTP